MAMSQAVFNNEVWSEIGKPIELRDVDGVTPERVATMLKELTDREGIPVAFDVESIKVGGLFSKKTEQACLLYHPQHKNDYLRFLIRLQSTGRSTYVFFLNLGGSKNYGNANRAEAGGFVGGLKSITNAIGGLQAKLEEEQLYYATLRRCIFELFGIG